MLDYLIYKSNNYLSEKEIQKYQKELVTVLRGICTDTVLCLLSRQTVFQAVPGYSCLKFFSENYYGGNFR